MIKKLKVLAAVAVISAGSFAVAAENQPVKVEAYYFHGAFRCPTCVNMEKYSRQAIAENFNDVLASGKLEFKAVNVEDPGNEHFVSDYKLYTKTLILSLVKGGKEVKHKNLDKIWELVGDKRKFMDYVTVEITDFIKDAQ